MTNPNAKRVYEVPSVLSYLCEVALEWLEIAGKILLELIANTPMAPMAPQVSALDGA